jgi:Zinc carboxypeptidase
MRHALFLALSLCAASLVVGATNQARSTTPLSNLKTRPERTNYEETSRYDDVVTFLNTVDAASNLVYVTTFGYSFEGRSLPLAVVGRLPDARPEAVKGSGKLRVYIQANVHAGEVEGKEAMLTLVREIALGRHSDWLDSIVLLIAPIYNADGNEKVSLTSRGPQHGPIGGSGTRANAQGLNINRDYIKLETPEVRSMVKLLNEYDPHVMMDLHTTDGSRHVYYLTYEVPNNPVIDPAVAALAQTEWMPSVVRTIKSKYDWNYHAYGNVSGQAPERAWTTVEGLPRYSHNYWGIRNRFGILSETYSYATFTDRITAATRFVEEVLNFARTNAAAIRKPAADADTRPLVGQRLSLQSKPKRSAEKVEILMGETVDEVNPYSGRTMFRRLDVRKPERMWEFASFESTESERVPSAYFIPAELRAAVERLRAHGVRRAARATDHHPTRGVSDRIDGGRGAGIRESP